MNLENKPTRPQTADGLMTLIQPRDPPPPQDTVDFALWQVPNTETFVLNFNCFKDMIYFMCAACIYVCVRGHACYSWRLEEGVLDPLELELQTVVS